MICVHTSRASLPDPSIRALPNPHRSGGPPLTAALSARRSCRDYTEAPLEPQMLSDLLWAAYGVNGERTEQRTAPCWRQRLVIDLYVARADGVWLYDAAHHALLLHLATDVRSLTGVQDFPAGAPIDLIYVGHGERMADVSPVERRLYAAVDTAFIGQNVYLYCASQGLGTVFRGAVDTTALGHTLGLGEGQFVTFAQTVGHPRHQAEAATIAG